MTADSLSGFSFVQVTPPTAGAVGVFHIYGAETDLVSRIDAVLRQRDGSPRKDTPQVGGLLHGWLFDSNGERVDEVMLAKPENGLRVLMCHGGVHICQETARYLVSLGVAKIDSPPDAYADLANCLTEHQAAALLERMQCAAAGQAEQDSFARLFHTYRVCLAGPPNAGKSSLLNRLSGFDRAFVHHEAGATRDAVGELVEIAGYAAYIEDLPGFVQGEAGVAEKAQVRALAKVQSADMAFFICDASRGWDETTDYAAHILSDLLCESIDNTISRNVPVAILINKSDLPSKIRGKPWLRYFPIAESTSVCSLPGGDAAEKTASVFFRLVANGTSFR